MILLNNKAEMQLFLNSIMQEALDNTMDKMLKELDRIIDNNVYGFDFNSIRKANRPWMSLRTFQFRDSWEKTKAQVVGAVGNIIESEINQDVTVMKQFTAGDNEETEVHKDRDNLAEIIETGNGYGLPNNRAEGQPRPFWNEFIKYFETTLDATFLQECRKLGLDIR